MQEEKERLENAKEMTPDLAEQVSGGETGGTSVVQCPKCRSLKVSFGGSKILVCKSCGYEW